MLKPSEWREGICCFCGEPELVEVRDYWPDTGEFMLDTCCYELHEATVEWLNDVDAKERAVYLSKIDGGILARPEGMRRVEPEDGTFRLDFNLVREDVTQAEAFAFVDQHHRHNRRPRGWRFGAAVRNGTQRIAVASVGTPVARAYNGRGVVEINRVCVRTDVPRPLVWNACSLLYGWAAREAKARGFKKIITYTRDDEDGTSLKAAGYTPEAKVKARKVGWRNRGDRLEHDSIGKTRWVRNLA